MKPKRKLDWMTRVDDDFIFWLAVFMIGAVCAVFGSCWWLLWILQKAVSG